LYFVAFVALVTFLIYYQSVKNEDHKKELFEKMNIIQNPKGEACTRPTQNNPFMNISFVDSTHKPKACKGVEEEVAVEFEKGLNRKEDDVFFKSASDRQFFTMPNTSCPNDQNKFAEWLFKTGPTLKEAGWISK
jgi:hypothetical protein